VPEEERPPCNYNEVVMRGGAAWTEQLPYIVEAVVFHKKAMDKEASENRARAVHAAFCTECVSIRLH
jgi:hypothetical protein|tara:strand:+ start:236 stop:436 length:201 start_codon:yes stop_codon:yes gene_type:complete